MEMRSRAAAPMPPRQFYSFSSSFITHVEMRSRAAAPTGARGRGGGVSIIPPADAAECGQGMRVHAGVGIDSILWAMRQGGSMLVRHP